MRQEGYLATGTCYPNLDSSPPPPPRAEGSPLQALEWRKPGREGRPVEGKTCHALPGPSG